MSSQKSGRQSPPPERQSGPQIDPASRGKTHDVQPAQEEDPGTSRLSSNPPGPLDQSARDKLGESCLDGL